MENRSTMAYPEQPPPHHLTPQPPQQPPAPTPEPIPVIRPARFQPQRPLPPRMEASASPDPSAAIPEESATESVPLPESATHLGAEALHKTVEQVAEQDHPLIPDQTAPQQGRETATVVERPRLVTSTADYVQAFQTGKPVSIPETAQLRGRIIRGQSPTDFDRLAPDERRLVFTMGSDGLEILPGRPLRQSLATIGLTPEYVQGRIDQGYHFKLAVFQANHPGTQATWENTLRQAAETYPELAEDIERHASVLPQQVLPPDIDQIDLAGPADPRFMTLDRYLALSPTERAGNPLALRRVLVHEVHLGSLFDGSGYTLTPDGKRGTTEHLMPNGPLARQRDAALIDLV